MYPGDLLLVVPKSNVPPGGRYAQGIITERSGVFVKILWSDGYHSRELVSNVTKYYSRISNENR